MTEEKLHHLYGGSSAKYWSVCYGWAALTSQLPHTPAGAAADRGTALHEGILERKTRAEVDHRTKGTPIVLDYTNIEGWPDDGPQMAEEFWQAIWVNALEQFITGKQVYIEKKLMLSEEQDAGGTADLVILYYNDKAQLCGVIGDLKTGYHRVEPSEEQILFYLAALYLRVKEKGKEIDVFKGFIYQPSHTEPYTEHTFTKAAVLKAVTKYEKAIAESKKPKPKFKAGDHCKWCKAQPVCKEYSKYLSKQMDLAVIDTKLAEVEMLPDDTLRNIFLYGDKIEEYISAVRKHIISRFALGKPIEGLKLVAGVSKRKWKDEMLAEESLKALGLEATTKKMMGITSVESMLKNMGLDKKAVAEVMYPLTIKPDAPPKVTTLEDKREAITLDSGVNLLIGLDDSDNE